MENEMEIETIRKEDDNFKYKAAFFLASVSGISAIIGFGATLASAKKHDPKYFNKGMIGSIEMTETGANLAMRALGWGTLYAFTGCGVLFFTIWKMSGANNFEEFRYKMGSLLPRLTKEEQEGRTKFNGINDLLSYLSTLKGSNE